MFPSSWQQEKRICVRGKVSSLRKSGCKFESAEAYCLYLILLLVLQPPPEVLQLPQRPDPPLGILPLGSIEGLKYEAPLLLPLLPYPRIARILSDVLE